MFRVYEQIGPSFDGASRLKRAVIVSVLLHVALFTFIGYVAAREEAKPLVFQMQLVNKKLGWGSDSEQGAAAAPKDKKSEAKAEASPPSPPPPPPEEKPKPEPPKKKKTEPPKKPEPVKEEKKKPDIAKPEPKKTEKKEKEKPKKKEEEKPKEKPKKADKKDAKKKRTDPDAAIEKDALTPLGPIAKNVKVTDTFDNNGDGSDYGIDPTKHGTLRGPAVEGPRGTTVEGIPGVLNAWAGLVQTKVERNWQKPAGLPLGMSVLLLFTVDREGNIIDGPRVIESSSAELSQSAMNAITQSLPLPPLPEDFVGLEQAVSYRFKISE